jgi:hypothetical protein
MIEELKHIATDLETRLTGARDSIAEAAMSGDWDKAQMITAAAKRLEEVRHQIDTLSKEIRRAITDFDAATRSHSKAKHTKLLIKIRWTLAGGSLPDQLIDDDNAADALASFVEALVSVQGASILPELRKIRVGPSGLVSTEPGREFRNPNNNEPYGYRPIGTTGWSVKTHSSTAQKLEQIHQIKTMLGLPREAIEVESVEK